MATCSSLPDEVLLHIIEALFEKLTINIAEPRPIEVLRKKRHRRNILCITAVSHKLRSIALAIFEKNRDNVEYTLADIRKFTGVTYRSRFSKVPFSAKLVQLTISAEQIYLCTDYLWPDLHRIARLAKIFPRLRKVIAKSEVSNPHGFNDKDEDAIGMQQYGQKTKFVVGMVKMAYGAHIKQHRRLLYSDWKCENIQLVSKLTFKWMGQTECRMTATFTMLEVRSFGYAPACIWAKELASVLLDKLPAVYVEQDNLYRQSLVEGGSSGVVVTQR